MRRHLVPSQIYGNEQGVNDIKFLVFTKDKISFMINIERMNLLLFIVFTVEIPLGNKIMRLYLSLYNIFTWL